MTHPGTCAIAGSAIAPAGHPVITRGQIPTSAPFIRFPNTMSKNQFPDSEEEVIDLLAKTKQLKIENDMGSVILESHNSVNIQPSGTPFGTKIKIAEGSNSAALTFDSKKMRPPRKNIDFDQLLDEAISQYDEAVDELSSNE